MTGSAVAAEPSSGDRAAFLDSILESSTEYAIVATDPSYTIQSWNEGARRLYGYETDDVVGKLPIFTLSHPDGVSHDQVQARFEEARASGPWSGELLQLRKNGTELSAYVTIALRRDKGLQPIGFTVISRVLTDRQTFFASCGKPKTTTAGSSNPTSTP
jgi:PAS domain S-box-containing protein